MNGKFDGMYTNYSHANDNERALEKDKKKSAYEEKGTHHTHENGKSNSDSREKE